MFPQIQFIIIFSDKQLSKKLGDRQFISFPFINLLYFNWCQFNSTSWLRSI